MTTYLRSYANNGIRANTALRAVHASGAAGAALDAGTEAVRGVSDLLDGSRSAGDVATTVASAGAKGYATGAAASAAATAGGAALASGLGAIGVGAGLATVAAPLALAAVVGWGVSSAWDSIFG
ncbi:MAG: hypothetical protein RL260_3446 [Pseudomonadota bacterium]|jgi:hypothetical protein